MCHVDCAKAWQPPGGARGSAGSGSDGASVGDERSAAQGCDWGDNRMKHVLASVACTCVVAFAVFGAPALARASFTSGGVGTPPPGAAG